MAGSERAVGQAVLALPGDGPLPAHADYERHLAEMLIQVIEAARGRTFVLFTAHGMLRRVAERTRDRLASHGFPILVQGTVPRTELLNRFREAGNAVLFGNQTFWEGVDVPGSALSCVVIARLPFRVPSHPLERGRIEDLEKRGENPFVHLSVPQAALSLKQGVGRLIRTRKDRGVIVIADSRILSRSYGRTFLNSLPDFRRLEMPWSGIVEEVRHFFREAVTPEERS